MKRNRYHNHKLNRNRRNHNNNVIEIKIKSFYLNKKKFRFFIMIFITISFSKCYAMNLLWLRKLYVMVMCNLHFWESAFFSNKLSIDFMF
jgi:hypothetical protein